MSPPRVFVIAEAGVNHNGSLKLSLDLVAAAAQAGADAVKFQTFRADRLVSETAPKAAYQRQRTDASESQHEMLRKLELDDDAHHALKARCAALGIEFMSTPFDEECLSFLVDDVGVGRVKISSGDLTNGPLLLQAAQSRRKIILSTGMGSLGEIEDALGVIAFGLIRGPEAPGECGFRDAYADPAGQAALRRDVTLLHCVSAYPAPPEQTNLRAMDTLAAAFSVPTGLSDHSSGIAIPLAAAARGATMIEKHLTLDRNLPGPDHAASLPPDQFAAMVAGIREIELALGDGRKVPTPDERDTMLVARRGIVARRAITAGEALSREMLDVRRPQAGLSPMRLWSLLGEAAPRPYAVGEPIDWSPVNRGRRS